MLKKHKILTITVASFLSLLLIFLIVLGTIAAVRASRAVLSYKGITVDEKTYSYFVCVGKVDFFAALKKNGVKNAEDNPIFYLQTDPASGKTYGELLSENIENYVRTLLVSSYLFDRSVGMDSDRKQTLADAESELLLRFGDKAAFNAAAEKYGFDYRAATRALELMYKSAALVSVILGSDGSVIAENTDFYEEYFTKNYAHAGLIFIRTDVIYDPDDGTSRPINSTELQEATEDIAFLREAIDHFHAGEDGQISMDMFGIFLEKYKNNEPDYAESGYYLAEDSASAGELENAWNGLIDAVFETEIGEYSILEYPEGNNLGAVVIYRDELIAGAYAEDGLSSMFADFYEDAANAYFIEEVASLRDEVKAGEKLADIDYVSILKDSLFKISF